jgi:putative FmdB family regulatory protein
MPTYQYRCAKCGEEFVLWQSIHDDALTRHPGCGGKVSKVLAPAGIVLKGSGFYRTDSRAAAGKGSGGSKDKEPAGTASGNGSGGDAKSSSDTKDAKKDAKKHAAAAKSESSKSGSSKT